MIYALDKNGEYRRPHDAAGECVCPACGEPVIRRQGELVVDHFAHQQGERCDPWFEQMTEWHLFWQAHVEPRCREVVCRYKNGRQPHRADMISPTGHVIEVQKSSLSVRDVVTREAFYSRVHRGLVWVVDASEFWERIEISLPGYGHRELIGQLRFELQNGGETGNVEFTWSHPRKCWAFARCPVYLDPGRMGDETRVFDGALFRLLSFDTGDSNRWDHYVEWDESTHYPDGEMPGGAGAFVSLQELKRRYQLRLPDRNQRNSDWAYPDLTAELPHPHHELDHHA